MLKIEALNGEFAVCRLKSLPDITEHDRFCFLSVTDGEISLVCPSVRIPGSAEKVENGWRGFRISGTLDFSLIGILAKVASLLANEKISIFAVSTYDTDYVFTKSDAFDRALAVLSENGYKIDYGA